MTNITTPLAGTLQEGDVETIYPTPRMNIRNKLRNIFKWDRISRVLWFTALGILVAAAPCFLFFSFVALGRFLISLKRGKNPPNHHMPDVKFEYLAAVLAGFLLLLIMGGTIALIIVCCDTSNDVPIVLGTLSVLSLLFIGPICVVLSTNVLQAKLEEKLLLGDLLLYYFVGFIAIIVILVLTFVLSR
ncbi:hypothetical protein DL96DRAFT_345230 [Flagelloscypha sp. PMI_526]|nr:hypothetical protein DL96DRAFT_345230 [Flagelloscypha sp. PMI_526]